LVVGVRFIRDEILVPRARRRFRRRRERAKPVGGGPPKKGGRGWLHS